ncbi:MAG: hypothetical protein JKY65_14890 [Planctomycetes bacterium]|nr:hypothetical protein [Planctomycetota bacterium]
MSDPLRQGGALIRLRHPRRIHLQQGGRILLEQPLLDARPELAWFAELDGEALLGVADETEGLDACGAEAGAASAAVSSCAGQGEACAQLVSRSPPSRARERR